MNGIRRHGKRFVLVGVLFLLAACAMFCGMVYAEETSVLAFALLEDGSGYEITGCAEDVATVEIPAFWQGLPVTGMTGEAFLNCSSLQSFTVEEGHPVFFEQDGVLFRNDPVKTLVRCPNDYGAHNVSYLIPEDTVAIGPYAFAGQQSIEYIHAEEGLLSLGDCAFARNAIQIMVYLPASLTEIGEKLMEGQQANIAFLAPKGSAVLKYASRYSIPNAAITSDTFDVGEKTVVIVEPDLTDAEGIGTPDPGKSNPITDNRFVEYPLNTAIILDVGEFWSRSPKGTQEIRMVLRTQWRDLIPDSNGMVRSGWPAMTGVYGIGHTEGETILRGYDAAGKLTGTRRVNGDFSYAFPGAVAVGFEGGTNTTATALPYQPIFIEKKGNLPLKDVSFYTAPDGSAFQFFAMLYPGCTAEIKAPNDFNSIAWSLQEADGRDFGYGSSSPQFTMLTVHVQDRYYADRTNQLAIEFSGMDTIYADEEIICYAADKFKLDETFGTKMLNVLQNVKAVMLESYYPAEAPINRITVSVTGEYPNAFNSIVLLDGSFAKYSDFNVLTYAHEMVHAVDQSMEKISGMFPSPWLEGRAEYISRLVCRRMGISCNEPSGTNGWRFLSAADREDFASYYLHSTNRTTTYTVGYWFLDYLCKTYGEDVPQRIMSQFLSREINGKTDLDELFLECVRTETDADVFQNFIRDVVEK